MNLNKVYIIGNITKNVELKALPNGSSVCNFSVATNRVWVDKTGKKQEDVEFHNVVVFGKMAETIAKYMGKGSQILVEGRLQTRSWDSKTGTKLYRTEIVVESFQFGAKPSYANNKEVSQEEMPSIDQGDELRSEDVPF